ncbi:hypothetical protein D3C77_300990 [compost metagenome]
MRFVDVLAIQVHAGLKAQRVTRAETARGNTCTDQIVEECGGLHSRKDDLQAVFAGIPGAGDKPVTLGAAFERLELADQRGARRR